jgi:cysteine desulfurase / selenocysteine lyase
MPLDVEALRADTPGCTQVVHLNNAGSALPARPVLDAVQGHLALEATRGGYEAATAAQPQLDRARAAAAELIGAAVDDVALTPSDTTAFAKVFWGMWLGGALRPGHRVLVDRLAYSSHHLALLQAARLGIEVVVVPNGPTGAIDLDALTSRLDERVGLVTATQVGTHSGPVGRITKAAGVPYVLDACQSLGQMPVDVEAIGCDALTGTGRKFLRAPRGTGLLYVRPELAERCDPPGIDGASADWTGGETYRLAPGARRFEEFETSYAARIGFGVAVDYALALGLDAIRDRVRALADTLRARLASIPGVHVLDGDGERSAIVGFTCAGHEPAAVQRASATNGINISVGPARGAPLDLGERGIAAIVRASPHCYNTDAELDRLVDVLASLS